MRFALAAILAMTAAAATPALAQDEVVVTGPAPARDEVIVTGGTAPAAETVDALRLREALAYSNPLPRGAPDEDYPLVAWCEALVAGHIALGETLGDRDALDDDLIRLGRAEQAVFRQAMTAAGPRQSAASRAAAQAAAEDAAARWRPLLAQEPLVRDQAFGLFMGLPGRCEHAARRLRDGVTTPPATLAEVGLVDAAEGE